jgi:hypothetical protein
MNFGVLAKTLQTAEHGGSGNLELQAFLHDSLIERLPFVSIRFGAVDTEKFSWLSQGHR